MANGDDVLKTWASSPGLAATSRIVQVVGVPLGVAMMMWVANTISGLQIQVTKLETQIEERTADRYSGTDARHDFATVAVQLDDLSRRVGVLEDETRGQQALRLRKNQVQ